MPFLTSIASTIESNPSPIKPANNIPIIATGGTVTTGTDAIGEYKIHTFNSNETFQLTQAYEGAVFQVLLVGAGEGGQPNGQGYRPVYDINENIVPFLGNQPWYYNGSGGSSGAVLYTSNLQIPLGNNSVVVGRTDNTGTTSLSLVEPGSNLTLSASGKGGGCSIPNELATLDSKKEHNLYYETHDGCPGAQNFTGDAGLDPGYRWNGWPYDKSWGWDKNYYGVKYDISGQEVAYAVPGPSGYRAGSGIFNSSNPTYNNTLQSSTTPGSGGKGNTNETGQIGIAIIKYYVNNPKNRIFLNGGKVVANTNYTCHIFNNVTNWPLMFDKLPADAKIDILVASPGNLEPFNNGGSGSVRVFYDQKVEFGDVYYVDALSLEDLKPGAVQSFGGGGTLFVHQASSVYRIRRGQQYTMGYGLSFEPDGNGLKINSSGSGYTNYLDSVRERYDLGINFPKKVMVDGGFTRIITDPMLQTHQAGYDSSYKKACEVRVRKYSTYFKDKPLTEWSLKAYAGPINSVPGNKSGNKAFSSNTIVNFFGYGTDSYDDKILKLSDYGNYVDYDPTGNVFSNTNTLIANANGIYLNFSTANVRYAAAATSNTIIRNPQYTTMQDQYVPPDPATVIIRYKSYLPPQLPPQNSLTVAPQTANSGSETFTTPGIGYWICPPGVYSVNVLCIGGGGAGGVNFKRLTATGGGSGGVAWKNNIPVVPGTKYIYKVGAGGLADDMNPPDPFGRADPIAPWPGGAGQGGEKSFFIDDWYVCASGGGGGTGGDRNIKHPLLSINPDFFPAWRTNGIIRRTGGDGESNSFLPASRTQFFAGFSGGGISSITYQTDTRPANVIFFMPPRDANWSPNVNILYTATNGLPSGSNIVAGAGYIFPNTNAINVYEDGNWNYLGVSSPANYNWLNQYNANNKNVLISVGGKGDNPDDPAIITGNARNQIQSQGGGWAGQSGGKGKSSDTGPFVTEKLRNLPYELRLSLDYLSGFPQPPGQPYPWDKKSQTYTTPLTAVGTGGAGAAGYDDSITSGGGGKGAKGTANWGSEVGTTSTGEPTFKLLDILSGLPGTGGGGVGVLGKGRTGSDAIRANTAGESGSNGFNGGVVSTKNYDWRLYQPRLTQVPGLAGTYGAGSGAMNTEGVDGFFAVVQIIPGIFILEESNMGRGEPGANGAVRIVWGQNRSWPNSNTATI
jgi:hypothetical protein